MTTYTEFSFLRSRGSPREYMYINNNAQDHIKIITEVIKRTESSFLYDIHNNISINELHSKMQLIYDEEYDSKYPIKMYISDNNYTKKQLDTLYDDNGIHISKSTRGSFFMSADAYKYL